MTTSATFHTKLKLHVWCLMPTEPPGTELGQDERDRDAAAVIIYDALKWIGNSSLVPDIVAGRMEPMWRRLTNTIERTGEVR